ncbi:MAG: glycosyltransferase family 2 protein [Chitinophagaceae bacterium]|nr:glycosyltransferase family 2 protein [Chitinophagaceae bacterium]
MNDYPLISVVVATYNGAKFIGAQLDSIITQTYPNIEIIIVDDNSTDETQQILHQYAATYENIKVHINATNLGYVKNFEKGMVLATGDFIAPSDQDDIWLPEKLSTLMHERGDHVIVYCNSILIDEQNNKIGKKLSDIKRLISYDNPIMFAVGNAAPGHAMLIKKELITKTIPFPTMIPHDYALGYMACFFGGLKYVDQPLVLYRQHQNNVFAAVKIADSQTQRSRRTREKKKAAETEKIRERVTWLYNTCAETHITEKIFFKRMLDAYSSFSFLNNCSRVALFLKYRDLILAHKNRSELRKILYAFKLFFKIV